MGYTARTIKEHENLKKIRNEIKTWKPDNCTYRLCKVYIEGVEFL